jgi:hypothetical protein
MDALQSQRLRTTFFNNVFPLLPLQKMNERIKDIYVLFTATKQGREQNNDENKEGNIGV